MPVSASPGLIGKELHFQCLEDESGGQYLLP